LSQSGKKHGRQGQFLFSDWQKFLSSKTISPNDLSPSTNDVCEVLYKDSSVNLVPLKDMAVTETTELV